MVTLHCDQGLQRNAVGDHKRRAILLDKTLLPEIRENPGDGLSRKSDHLRDFLVAESKLQPGLPFDGFPVLGAQFRSSFASFSAAECDSPSQRTSLQAL